MLTGAVMSGAVFSYTSVSANNGLLQQTPPSFIAVIVLNGFPVILKNSLLLHTRMSVLNQNLPLFPIGSVLCPQQTLDFP